MQVSWWQYFEGRLLLVQALILGGFLLLAAWVYYVGFYSHVHSPDQLNRCITGEAAALLGNLMMAGYSGLCCLWQLALVIRRRRGKPSSVWGLVVFIGALLPICLLIVLAFPR